MKNPFASLRKHQPDVEALSAYADGRLDAGLAAALAAHIETCVACTMRLAELRQVKTMLAAMPEQPHPRSFRLRQADVEAPAPAAAASRSRPASHGGLLRAMPVMSALGVFAFAVVVAADVSTRNDGGRLASSDRSIASLNSDSAEFGEDAAAGQAQPPATGAAPGAAPGAVTEADGKEIGAGAEASSPAPGAVMPGAPEDTAAREDSDDAQTALTDSGRETRMAYDQIEATINTADDGNDGRIAFCVLEVGAAAIAIAAGAMFVIGRTRRNEGRS